MVRIMYRLPKVRLKNLMLGSRYFYEENTIWGLRKKFIITELYEKLCIFGKYFIIPVTD